MPKLYKTILAGFTQVVNGLRVEPLMYQPTPEGLDLLCSHYRQKYQIDLQCINLERHKELTHGDNLYQNFKCFKRHYSSLLEISEGQCRAFILCYKQNHVIPVFITKHNKKLHMVVFDSTSGPRIKGYFNIALLFPDAAFFVNEGTRQGDGGSCLTDAICILKEALQINNLLSLITARCEPNHSSLKSNPNSRFRFYSVPRPSNFNLFRMPENLLLTAQRSEYIKKANADLTVELRDGRSLKQHLERCRIWVEMPGAKEKKLVNAYLFEKAEEHKRLLDILSTRFLETQSSHCKFKAIAQGECKDGANYRDRNLTTPYPIHPHSKMLLNVMVKAPAPTDIFAQRHLPSPTEPTELKADVNIGSPKP